MTGETSPVAFCWRCTRCGHGWDVVAAHHERVRCPACHLRQRVSLPGVPDRRRRQPPTVSRQPPLAVPEPEPAQPPAAARRTSRRLPAIGEWLATRGIDYDHRAARAGRCGIEGCRKRWTHHWHAETLPEPATGTVRVCGAHFAVLEAFAAAQR